VATDGITPPIWFGQGCDPEILGILTVFVHLLVDEVNCSKTEAQRWPFQEISLGPTMKNIHNKMANTVALSLP
jgi:hypothetical protein